MNRACFCLLVCALGLSCASAHGQAAKFVDVTAIKNLSTFTSSPGDGHGPGAVFTDLNGDGYADIYMVRAFNQSNGMFLNTLSGGQRTFVRANGDAGAGDTGAATGAIAGDYDNDGDADLFVINFNEPNVLLKNQLAETGQFNYVNVTAQTDPSPSVADNQFGLANANWAGVSLDNSLTAAWGDPDRDGDLDLYVGNHHEWYGSPWLQAGEIAGQRDIFYRNNGDGTFSDTTMGEAIPGFETSTGAYSTSVQNYSSTNAVVFADFNNDQWPDLLVTNKIGGPTDRDMLYVNQGADANGNWLGYSTVTYSLPTKFGHLTGGAMGVDVADLDNDGDLDFYMTDWSNPNNFPNGGANDLWINQLSETGTLNFVHSNIAPGLFSWGTQLEDFDNNGYQDIHVATEIDAADFLYLNSAEGSLGDVATGAGVDQVDNARGDVSADFNRDGLLDLLVINPYDGPSVLYENRSDEVTSGNHFLSLKLEGDPTLPGRFKSSRDAIGARVYVSTDLDGDGTIEPNERLLREVLSGSSNAASSSSLDLEFGLGKGDTALVEILWPSGRRTTFTTAADQFLAVGEIPGDYDEDGIVTAGDYQVWKNSFGSMTNLAADGNGNGTVDAADYTVWRDGLGKNAVAASAVGTTSSVPEPGAMVLWMVAGLGIALAGRVFPR